MDCDEPHLAPNEKTQPIQWTEWPTGALMAAGSLWPIGLLSETGTGPDSYLSNSLVIISTVPKN
jgi:hypothetical protein